MSRINFLPIVLLLLFWNCKDKEMSVTEVEIPVEDIDSVSIEKDEEKTPSQDFIMKNWLTYYENYAADFSKDNFVFEDSIKLVPQAATTHGVWEKDFDEVYKPYLSYNSDSTIYIDIHSYKWKYDNNGELVIGPDQEIVLGNLRDKTVRRLMYYGPSYWIEDAYFENDSIVVLLENSTDKIPAYQKFNINTGVSASFIYKKPLSFSSTYLKDRILNEKNKEF